MPLDGSEDLARAARDLAGRIPPPLEPLARLAFNYWWSWAPGGADLFREIDPEPFELIQGNPVRLLQSASAEALRRAERDRGFLERMGALADGMESALGHPPAGEPDRPAAFFCMEFGIHSSLPFYSGGLGVLAGDVLKEASDRAVPMVGVGLMYREGGYHQRLDRSGWQHDHWLVTDAATLPEALVRGEGGEPLLIRVPVGQREVVAQVWRVDVGRVPLFLLDAFRPENDVSDRWISGRLYVGDPRIRLAQYALLGMGGVMALRRMGIEPGVVHLNEGHAALAPIELAAAEVASGMPFEDALERARGRTVFTTHTPVAAGNETHPAGLVLDVLGRAPARLGVDPERFLGLGRIRPQEPHEEFGMTVLALRAARWAGGVSELHGRVAREMWRDVFPEDDPVPIDHVTNGVHLPTWMAAPVRELLDRHLEIGWAERADDPRTWVPVEAIPDEDLWALRSALRGSLVDLVRERSVLDRLGRGESSRSVEAARGSFDPDVLTVGFARRVALYKRAYLLTADPERATALLSGDRPIQVVIAGKAHPEDAEAKRSLQQLFAHPWGTEGALRVAFLEDYDMALAAQLVAGCDVWVNLPRPPLEASGTSGMKAVLNGGLHLSVLDGWWAEAYDGENGWAIRSPEAAPQEQDDRDARALYDLMEREAVPLFHDQDPDGIPRGWVRRIKRSLQTLGPRFCATRMLSAYRGVYAGPEG